MFDSFLTGRRRRLRTGAAAFALLATFAVHAQTPVKRAITHEDVWLAKRLGATATSPDGRWIVVAVSEPAYDDDKKSSDLWIVPSDGSAPPRPLTAGRSGEGDADWSPDSTRIAFSSKREGDDEAQVYVLYLAGGEARRVTNVSTGAKAPHFSPDGRTLLFTSMVYPGATNDEENRQRIADRKARKYNVRAFDSFPIRHWDRWLDERRPTLMVQPVDGSAPARDLLAGTTLRASSGYGGRLGNEGDTIDASFAPDGQSIVFAATSNRDQAAHAETFLSLWQQRLDGGEPVRLTAPGVDYSDPAFTSDGRALLAKAEAVSEKWVFNATRLVRLPWPASESTAPKVLTADFDRNVGNFSIAPGDRTVYFTAEDSGLEKLFSVPVEGGEVDEVGMLEHGVYTQLSVGGDEATPVIAALWGSAVNPAEIGRIDVTSGRWSALGGFNDVRVAELDLAPVESFWFESRGARIHNMLVKPPGFDPSKKYPLFVVIHGGPHTMFRDEFGIRWNYHLLAKPGYVVLLTNYSGSTGFGEAFARRIQGDPLKGPADEINRAADLAVERYAFIDGTRRAAGGASYGGHLTNWLAVTSDDYKALVSHAGLFDLRSQWTTSDSVYHRERNAGGPAWEGAKVWREQSPFYRAEKLKTPILVTVGEKDFRVPMNNALEFWTVLQRQQVPSRLLVFPDENHWILKGEDSRYFYGEVAGWLAKHL